MHPEQPNSERRTAEQASAEQATGHATSERQYLALMRRVLEEGEAQGDRTGTGTLSLFGERMRLDLREGFPLLTTKRMHMRGITQRSSREAPGFSHGDS